MTREQEICAQITKAIIRAARDETALLAQGDEQRVQLMTSAIVHAMSMVFGQAMAISNNGEAMLARMLAEMPVTIRRAEALARKRMRKGETLQ